MPPGSAPSASARCLKFFMFALRILLILCLLLGGAALSLRIPWRGVGVLNDVPYYTNLPETPFYQKPAPPQPKDFGGKISPYLHPDNLQSEVFIDLGTLFWRATALIVGLLCLYGLIGALVAGSPTPADVLLCLWSALGLLLGTVLCVTYARLTDREPLPLLKFFWAPCVGLAWLAWARQVLLRRSRPVVSMAPRPKPVA
jgi:hypothetical protein